MISSQTIVLVGLLMSIYSSAVPISSFREELIELDARADGVTCTPLTIDQLKGLAAWSKIDAYAQKTWGTGGVNIVTNPTEYQDAPANACVKNGNVQARLSDKPQCQTSFGDVSGSSDGTTSVIKYSIEQGTQQSATWSVSQTTQVANSVSFNVGINIPDLISVGTSTSSSTVVQNSRSSTFKTTSGTISKTSVEYVNAPGGQCSLKLKQTTCSADASGQIPIVATGWVWYNYDSSRPPLADPKGGSHYKYAVSIDAVLSEAERTTYMAIQGPVSSTTKAEYKTNCVPKGSGTHPPAAAKPAVAKAVKGAAVKPAAGKPSPPKPAAAKQAPKPNGKKRR